MAEVILGCFGTTRNVVSNCIMLAIEGAADSHYCSVLLPLGAQGCEFY